MSEGTPKRGRPPKSKAGPATAAVLVRVAPADRERYQVAADAAGVTLANEARRAWERLARRPR